MDKEFCKIIDQDDLVEKYIEGNLHGELLNRFIEHIGQCEEHSQAVTLEKALQRGVRDFARSELKSNLHHRIKKQEISKYYILRYAAILIIAVIAPIILYYQFKAQPEILDLAREEMLVPVTEQEKSIEAESVKEVAEEPSAIKAPADEEVELKKVVQPATPDIRNTRRAAKMPAAKTASHPEAAMQADISLQLDDLIITPESPELKQELRESISNQEQQILSCIPDDIKSGKNRILLIFSLNTKGEISNIRFEPPDLLSQEIRLCITKKIQNWHLPPPAGKSLIKKAINF